MEVIDLSDETIDKLANTLIGKRKKITLLKSQKELRNIKLLLEQYRYLENHTELPLPDFKSEIPNSYKEHLPADELSIQSMLGYRARSKEMMILFKEILKRYKGICDHGDEEQKRRYGVVDGYYLSRDFLNKNKLAKKYHCDPKTIDRDMKKAISELSVMTFGLDGINDMSK
ncbi:MULTISPECIES: hypothetical protein [Companilactobacillus]|uniref:hypothetical protein n=1 Tax=Companilactobacillus TaxID=2767879 RepID=UPI0007111D59|nr:hypothetical protein [Companilactobacillus nantensis]GEO64451.1 hypothetical protein LNA01_16340 [Companilactobacillus nantensis]